MGSGDTNTRDEKLIILVGDDVRYIEERRFQRGKRRGNNEIDFCFDECVRIYPLGFLGRLWLHRM